VAIELVTYKVKVASPRWECGHRCPPFASAFVMSRVADPRLGVSNASSHFAEVPCCIGNPCLIDRYHSSKDLRRTISQSVSTKLVHCLPSIPRRTRSSVTSRVFSGYFDASLRATPTSCCARSSHISHRSNRSSSVRPTTNLPSISRPASFG
jgi:hypothetical protein